MTDLLDAHGNPMRGDADTVDLYDRTIDRLVRFNPEALDLADELAGATDPVPMAHVLRAYLNLMSTDVADLAAAGEAQAALAASPANDRERSHAVAIAAWAAGDWGGAARRLDDLLLQWPTDVLALMLGHQLDFFTGDADALRDRPLRTLRELDPQHPHAPFVRGMSAFGLEEAGDYAAALDAGRAAVAVNADDVWAIHAVVHSYEMQGRIDEGVAFLRSDETRWESGNLFTVHNWWHLALFELEAGRTERALAIYDAEVHHAASLGVPIEMLDAERAALAAAAGGRRHRWSLRPAGGCVGADRCRGAVVRVQRPPRRHGRRRRGPVGPGRRDHRPARRVAAGCHGVERVDDRRDRPAGMSCRRRVRRGSP